MKNILLLLAMVAIYSTNAYAHYLWIETAPTGSVGTVQEIRVHYGEYTYGLLEKPSGDAFKRVDDFTLYVINSAGKKEILEAEPYGNYYRASFTPSAKGTYTVVLDSDNIDVIDFTKYNFGIFKPHYAAFSQINVESTDETARGKNPTGLAIHNISTSADSARLKVYYKGKALAESDVEIFVQDQWKKQLQTDENGVISFDLPWRTTYVVEVTKKEEVPGTYNNTPYEFIWHCATVTIN